MSLSPAERERFSRQLGLPGWGEPAQARLRAARVLLVGCGGLGGSIATLLVRAGVGFVRILDPDRVERSNLPRQLLYGEADADAGTPKVEAAARELRGFWSEVTVEPLQRRFDPEQDAALLWDVDLLLDATDSLGTRMGLNRLCLAEDRPWVHGGVSGTGGAAMVFYPRHGPCLACLYPELPPEPGPDAPPPQVLGPLPTLVAAVQASAALRLLLGDAPPAGRLLQLDPWHGLYHVSTVQPAPHCPACAPYREAEGRPPRQGD